MTRYSFTLLDKSNDPRVRYARQVFKYAVKQARAEGLNPVHAAEILTCMALGILLDYTTADLPTAEGILHEALRENVKANDFTPSGRLN